MEKESLSLCVCVLSPYTCVLSMSICVYRESRDAAGWTGGKDECQVRLTGNEREYWMGTEIGRLGGYGFRGTVTAGDGFDQKGKTMGAGYVNLWKQGKRQQRKVGREEEGSSSNSPELAAFVLALRGTPMTKPMHNQALLKAVKR